jgi:hypothetical protein
MSFALAGCAGPMSPFGAIDGFGHKAKRFFTQILPPTGDGALVQFSPARQVLHRSSPFSIIIEDPEGVPENFELTLTYNGQDVTSQFLARAERGYLDPLKRQLKLTSKSLRLLPERDNLIYVSYRRDEKHEPSVRQFAPPSCSAFEPERGLASLPEFKPGPGVLDSINRYSGARHLNPYLVAGLIAQESSFDPRALSRSKAIGLTQITALGEGEVIKRAGEWPRSPEVNEMSLLELRLAILTGKLHAGNEWRLNPDLSVRGGVEYLDYIAGYWQRPDKREQVDKYLGATDLAFSELILASYNSGPARVSEALERKGSDWIHDEELTEARRYVRRVSSFCDHFPRGQDEQ